MFDSKMAPGGIVIPSVAGATATLPLPSISLTSDNKRSWLRRAAPCFAFLAAFSTAMTLLLVWSEAAALRRQAFDKNLQRDYVLNVSMDNSQLVSFIREIHLKRTTGEDSSNVTESPEEKIITSYFKGKRDGVYVEYISRPGAKSTTSWLEHNYAWHGLLVVTDFRAFFEACRSKRHPKTRVLHACLSTDKDTRVITYHQEAEVRVTKLDEGPNSLSFSDEGLPTMILQCFPLYSVLLAYNHTNIDYLSLDSTESSDVQVLDAIPWDTINITLLSIRWSNHHNEQELNSLKEKMRIKQFRFVEMTDSGRLMFTYSRLKI
ncbi:hypothetical protein PV325_003134 [Microctonus aethiopoides]|uniref:Protein Star n=1 Tax=Microctonus aethiopoides TaxID=144406 RepID=A0AA39KKU5_9HYME|nr:hypothetical protein PV325_003134 [Microctonus aethiopoides]KAK0165190.1 hypothetical protein PV328_003731 [Microctonus aethiopoides]